MNFLDLLWIILLISAFQPVIAQRLLEAARQRKIEQIERLRGSRVITLVHRQETMQLLGFPVMRYIDVHDSEAVLRAIHMTDPKVPLDIILHTPGGLVLAALQVARALKDHPGKVTVHVPHYAMSGGTMIALAADEIIMCSHAVLGPVDPQLGDMPAASLQRAVKQKPIDKLEDRTLVLADIGQKAITQVQAAVADLLKGRMEESEARAVAEKLASGHWTHDYPISSSEAKALGLPVNTTIPNEVLELMTLYPQPTRTLSSVEYLPGWKRADKGGNRAKT
ncbi:MAG TPA: hypothetical protein EYH03_02895 [Chromatiales bacterium]|nr:hypothetical protein [Chromatiales bacterium]